MFNSFQPSVAFYIETSPLICIANQMIGFYMERNTALKWLTSSQKKTWFKKHFRILINYMETGFFFFLTYRSLRHKNLVRNNFRKIFYNIYIWCLYITCLQSWWCDNFSHLNVPTLKKPCYNTLTCFRNRMTDTIFSNSQWEPVTPILYFLKSCNCQENRNVSAKDSWWVMKKPQWRDVFTLWNHFP